jgi:chromosome segregation ATPase
VSELEQAGLVGVVTAGSLAVLNWFLRRSDTHDADAATMRTQLRDQVKDLLERVEHMQARIDHLEAERGRDREALAAMRLENLALKAENATLRADMSRLNLRLLRYEAAQGPPDDIEDAR